MAGYNGWSNYETWAVKLWMDNDYGIYSYFQAEAGEIRDTGILAPRIQEFFEEQKPEVTGLWADLLNAALSEVNWDEIAQSLVDDLEPEEEE